MLIRAFLFIAFIFSSPAFAATIQSIKSEKMLITLNGQNVQVGERFFVLNGDGKKKALIRIRQVKEDRAIAELIKGQVQVGFKLSNTPSSASSPSSTVASPTRKSYTRANAQAGNSWGVLGSLLQSDMQVSFIPASTSTKTSVAMKGTSYGVLGFYDYTLSPEIQLRALGGLESFKVSGTGGATDCDGGSNCNVDITYLSTYGGAKYYFYNRNFKLWAGASYGFLFAMNKASTVLKTADITSNQLWVLSFGMDYPLAKNAFIPLSIDYGIFPSSATVKANILYLRAGWGTSF